MALIFLLVLFISSSEAQIGQLCSINEDCPQSVCCSKGKCVKGAFCQVGMKGMGDTCGYGYECNTRCCINEACSNPINCVQQCISNEDCSYSSCCSDGFCT